MDECASALPLDFIIISLIGIVAFVEKQILKRVEIAICDGLYFPIRSRLLAR